MRFTYVASDNSAGDAQALGAAGQDIYVRKVIFGAPADGKITNFYNAVVAPGHASGMGSVSTTNIALQHTQATHAAGTDFERFLDFSNAPLQLDGGSFHTNASDVTVIWEPVDEATQ
ncbi:hypothetical protein M0R04_13515 [Candidatus Dojkabacteria bacterium]|jgi:hypothetical protein|nr:hypothetical protein [Candidatus Dojkabacteria bacterium]